MTRREALDRWSQHTQHCPDCQAALRRIDAALPLLAAAAVGLAAAAGIALATGSAPLLSWRVAGCAAGAALAALLRAKLEDWRRLFIFTDYVHAEKN
jgi:pheophorbide a oxygenase